MRRIRFRLRTLMILVVFVALGLTVVTQWMLLRRAAIRTELHQVRAEHERLAAMQARAKAEVALAEQELAALRADVERARMEMTEVGDANQPKP
jgi:hypothetical protein